MVGLDLAQIHNAVAVQIRNQVARDINVADHPNSGMTPELIEVWPGEPPYVDYALTYGTTGIATIKLRIKVVLVGDAANTFKRMTDFLSAGTGNPSSIYDALKSDLTFGGVVSSLQTMTADWDPDENEATSVAWIPAQLTVSKQ